MSDLPAAVAIGRNEGDRLVRSLASLKGRAAPIVYVDSGSTDGSVAAAEAAGVEVVTLDMSVPFTAARARNAGYARVKETAPHGVYVQFLDGDCEIDEDWLEAAVSALEARPDVAVVCGRRREKFPENSLYNRMIDAEWDRPPGETKACGGDALMRREAFDEVGGYRPDLIAGEEPEMCYRMRQKGWRILRLPQEMTRHDADITRFSQWWKRSRRAGHTYAQGVALYGSESERYRVPELRRTLIWGAGIPLAAFVGVLLFGAWALLILLAWPLQVLRLWTKGMRLTDAFFLTLGKIAEVQGAFGYWIGQISGRRFELIEYK